VRGRTSYELLCSMTSMTTDAGVRGARRQVAGAPASGRIRPLARQALLPDRIVKQLKEMLISGKLRPGEALPSEAVLATRFDVARPTIREAKKALSLIGLLDVQKGRGSFVHRDALRRLDLTQVFDRSHTSLLDIFEGRRILEGSIVGLAAERATRNDLQQMRAAVGSMAKAAREGDVAGIFRGDGDFHFALAGAAHNTYLFRAVASTRALLEDAVVRISQVPDNVDHAVNCHREILSAIEARDAKKARDILLHHLDDSEKTIKAALA